MGFTRMCLAATALLWFAAPSVASGSLALACVVIANLGFEFGTTFNNAVLSDIVREERLGWLSDWPRGLGYAGGLTPLAAFVQPATLSFGLDREQAEPVRIIVDFRKEVPIEAIGTLTQGRRVDVAIEALGMQQTFESALRALRPGATLSSLGVYSSDLRIPLDAFTAGLARWYAGVIGAEAAKVAQ
jgi:Zinc-binding dehydrogenase